MLKATQDRLDEYNDQISWAHDMMTGSKMMAYIETVHQQEGDYAAAAAYQFLVTTRFRLFALTFYAESFRGKYANRVIKEKASQSLVDDLKYLNKTVGEYGPFSSMVASNVKDYEEYLPLDLWP